MTFFVHRVLPLTTEWSENSLAGWVFINAQLQTDEMWGGKLCMLNSVPECFYSRWVVISELLHEQRSVCRAWREIRQTNVIDFRNNMLNYTSAHTCLSFFPLALITCFHCWVFCSEMTKHISLHLLPSLPHFHALAKVAVCNALA